MAKKLSETDRMTLERLMKSCMLTLDFLGERAGFPDDVLEAGREGVRKAYDARDVRGLRMAERDFTELSNALPADQRQELETHIRLLADHDRDDVRREERAKVANALRRGRIADESEYRAAMARLDEIAGEFGSVEEADRLESLTAAFGRKDG